MPGLDAPDPSAVPRLHAYTSVWRLRADAWTSLADVTKRLADSLTPTDLRPGLQARITELVLLLDPLETYWAYPGRGQLQQIGALCDTGDYESAMRLTDTVSRQLSGRDDPTGRPAFQVLYHSVCAATPQILPVVLWPPAPIARRPDRRC